MSSQSPPPRRPGGRRPIPPLIFLLVLAVLALGVWWKVLRKEEAPASAGDPTCTAVAAPNVVKDLSNMKTIKIVVLNGAGKQGLAAKINADFQKRGFTVTQIGNAESDPPVTGVGTIQYGPTGAFAAQVLALHSPGMELVDVPGRKDATVTFIAGPDFADLAKPEAIKPAIDALIQKTAKEKSGCGAAATT